MAVLSTSALRARVAAAVAAVDGWTESRYAADLLHRDTDQLAHHSFAVGISSTSAHPAAGRQVRAAGLYSESTIEIRWAHRLTADAQVTATDAALDGEVDLIDAVLWASEASLQLVWTGSSRRTDPAGWILMTTTFRAIHRI